MKSESRLSSAPVRPIDAAQGLMLDVLGQPPVMFHRVYVGVTGSINAALWLSFAMGHRAHALAEAQEGSSDALGLVWFSFTREECEDGTGLTRHQQETARRDLRQIGIVLEQRKLTTEVAINTRKLGQLLMDQSRSQWDQQFERGTTAGPIKPVLGQFEGVAGSQGASS